MTGWAKANNSKTGEDGICGKNTSIFNFKTTPDSWQEGTDAYKPGFACHVPLISITLPRDASFTITGLLSSSSPIISACFDGFLLSIKRHYRCY